jgi:hypothetical protein
MSRREPPAFVNWDVKGMVAVWAGTCKKEDDFRELFASQDESDELAQSPFAELFAIFYYDENVLVQIYRPELVAVREILDEAPYSGSFVDLATAAAKEKGIVAATVAVALLNFVYVGDAIEAERRGCSLRFIGNFPYSFEAPGLPPWLFESSL